MRYSSLFVFLMLLSISMKSFACKCSHPFTPAEMYQKADFVFYGQSSNETVDPKKKEIQFSILRVAKGNEGQIGSERIAIRWTSDETQMCRGFQSSGEYLVFAVRNANGALSFLTDCYSEVISVQNGFYQYKKQKVSEFDFFKVNPLSAVNGVRPRYADQISKSEAQQLARQHLFQNAEFKKIHGPEMNMWVAGAADQKKDEQGQPFWSVRIAYTPPRAKGEFYVVRFYNTASNSFQIQPGE